MSIWNPGNQTIGIVTVSKVLDGGGNPVLDENGLATTQTTVVDKTGCVFEVQISAMPGRAEDVTATTTTTKQTAWAIFPPDADTMALTDANQLIYNGRTFDMRGDSVTEVDMDGLPSHVFALCEFQS